MFGEHDRDKAEHICAVATAKFGVPCKVVPGIEDPKKFTVAVPITERTPLALLKEFIK